MSMSEFKSEFEKYRPWYGRGSGVWYWTCIPGVNTNVGRVPAEIFQRVKALPTERDVTSFATELEAYSALAKALMSLCGDEEPKLEETMLLFKLTSLPYPDCSYAMGLYENENGTLMMRDVGYAMDYSGYFVSIEYGLDGGSRDFYDTLNPRAVTESESEKLTGLQYPASMDRLRELIQEAR